MDGEKKPNGSHCQFALTASTEWVVMVQRSFTNIKIHCFNNNEKVCESGVHVG